MRTFTWVPHTLLYRRPRIHANSPHLSDRNDGMSFEISEGVEKTTQFILSIDRGIAVAVGVLFLWYLSDLWEAHRNKRG